MQISIGIKYIPPKLVSFLRLCILWSCTYKRVRVIAHAHSALLLVFGGIIRNIRLQNGCLLSG